MKREARDALVDRRPVAPHLDGILPAEREAVKAYALAHPKDGYRRLARDRAARGLTGAAALAAAEAGVAGSVAHALAAELQIRIARSALTRAVGC